MIWHLFDSLVIDSSIFWNNWLTIIVYFECSYTLVSEHLLTKVGGYFFKVFHFKSAAQLI